MAWQPTTWKFAEGEIRGVIDLHHNGQFHWRVWRVTPWGLYARGKAPTLDRARDDAEAAAARLGGR